MPQNTCIENSLPEKLFYFLFVLALIMDPYHRQWLCLADAMLIFLIIVKVIKNKPF